MLQEAFVLFCCSIR